MEIKLETRQETLDRLCVEIKGMNYTYCKKNHELRIRGGVYEKEGFEWIEDWGLIVKADIEDESGNVLRILKDHDMKRIDASGYDSFEMSCYDANIFSNAKGVLNIKVFVAWERDEQ